jgi:Protein of unknown function (DUF3027)
MPEQSEQVEPAEAVAVEAPEPVESTDAAETPVGSTDAPETPVESTDAPARVFAADQVLLESVDLARRALLDVTPAETVGSVAGHLVEDEHVLTLLFAADLSGYPGWHWSVTIARVDDGEPTVLETELMPGETALLAPEWVPWSERLADYRAAQEAAAAAAAEVAEGEARDEAELDEDEEDLDEDELDEDEIDEDDEDEDESDLDDEAELDAAFGHDAGDDAFDGIDIDALDDSGDDEDDADDTDADDDDADDTDDDAADDEAVQPAEPRS